MSFSRDHGLDSTATGQLERALDQIHEEEQDVARENLGREAIRAQGGGPVRRALARIWPSLRPRVPGDQD